MEPLGGSLRGGAVFASALRPQRLSKSDFRTWGFGVPSRQFIASRPRLHPCGSAIHLDHDITIRKINGLVPENVGFQVLSLRQSLPSEQSPRPFGTAEKPRKRGLLLTKLLTAASARNAVLVSLSPVVSKAPDFAILVRNFKRLRWCFWFRPKRSFTAIDVLARIYPSRRRGFAFISDG